MNVINVFKSIQGEGPYIGCPMIFIRYAGCNLACPWCDTKYSWEGGIEYTRDHVAQAVVKYLPVKTICFTGGEPMMQQYQLARVIDILEGRNYSIHIETNGTLPLTENFSGIDVWVISPKFGHIYPAVIDGYLNHAAEASAEAYLKFVIQHENDVLTVKDFVKNGDYDDVTIIIQPERYTFAGLRNDVVLYLSEMHDLIKWCDKHLAEYEYRVLPQLHYLIWGDKRGV